MRPACRAFFSYSFRPDNNDLVGLISDQLLCLGFEIVEGDDPRPTSVSEKVKGKIDSCDVVVVLMTNELATSEGCSASDWVKQEAIYALGRRLPVIRLIEDGVATDGKMFGDQEYIPFERSNPAKAIVTLGRMLRSIKDGKSEAA